MISGEGKVVSTTLISGHPMLAPAFIDAVKKWEYRPFLKDGQPVAVVTRVEWTVASPAHSAAQEKALKDYYPAFDKCYRLVRQGDQSQEKDAEGACREAVALADELPENRVLERSGARTFLAHALYHQHRFDEAIPLYEKALEIRKGYENSDRDADFAEDNANLARAYLVSGQPEKADPFYAQSVVIFRAAIANLPEMKENYSTRLKRALLEYSKLKTVRGQTEEAAELRAEADQIASK